MNRRISVSLLILALLVQNSVVACAHIHTSTCGDKETVANRPHLHLKTHSPCNHEHSHDVAPNCRSENHCQHSGENTGDSVIVANFVAILPAFSHDDIRQLPCLIYGQLAPAAIATAQRSARQQFGHLELQTRSSRCAIYLQICALLI